MNARPYEYDRNFRPIGNSSLTVYKGILNGLDVAIKRAKNIESYSRLERESQILSNLNHTNIPKFYGKSPEELETFIEFVHGESLADLEDIKKVPDSHRFTNHGERVIEKFKYILKNSKISKNIDEDIKIMFNTKKRS
ncbi:MAG: hypothetical protein ACP5NV_06795, partial [Candidatus Woesearchaeota archaeon]